MINILDKVEGISFTYFQSKDVVRHPLVQRIVDAYEAVENKNIESTTRDSKESKESGQQN